MALTLSRITEGLDPETDWDSKALLTGSQQKSLFSDTFSKKPEIEVEPDPEPESESESESLPEDQTTSDEDLKRESTGSASVKGLSSGKKRKKKRPEKPKGGTNLEDFL